MSTNKITAALVALAAAAVLAGCSTGPAPDTSAAAPASSTVAAAPTLPNLDWLSDRVDLTAAKAALTSGRPFAFAIPDGTGAVCHTGVVTPDGALWFLYRSTAPVEGAALRHAGKLFGCTGPGMNTPGGEPEAVTPATPYGPTTAAGPTVPDMSWLSKRVDLGAAQRAMREGKPFIFGLPDGDITCHTGLLLPDGGVWVMNRSGSAPVAGVALDLDDLKQYGCRAGTPNQGGN
jgi:hypothetical protein